MNVRIHLLATLSLLALSSPQALARTPKAAAAHKERLDQHEVEGRALFARGEYQGALDIYVNLFAEKGDPIYLRNIGRCYQKLEQPDKAINSFNEYLRRGHVKASERSEVEGFIQEMEQLRKRQQETAATQPPADNAHGAAHGLDSPPAAMAPPAATEPAAPATSTEAPGTVLTQQAPAEPATDSGSSITGRWWFWTAVAVVVAGGAVGVYAATRTQPGVIPSCTPNATMFCSSSH
jgi:hypothetical protein